MNGIDLTSSEIYYGSNSISEVYLGSNLIWSQNSGEDDTDYSLEYLTFEALQDGTLTFWVTPICIEDITSISYSKNYGRNWTTINSFEEEDFTEISVNVSRGDRILWKGIATKICDAQDPNDGSFFHSTGLVNVSGNIMSLFYGDNFSNKHDIKELCNLFSFPEDFQMSSFGIDSIIKIRDASKLVLPATTLTAYCYYGMFYSSETLKKAPKLLPATSLEESCYESMFADCTSLEEAPDFSATTLAEGCCDSMFSGCTSLMSISNNCLPATTLSKYCYHYMFNGCTSLTTAPELPATTLANYCYSYMFNGCSSLTTAPALPATNLMTQCYAYMFKGCTSLNYIKCLATNISASRCTQSWVSGVAASGTFVKAASADWSGKTGNNGIPSGWTVQNA